MPQPTHPPPSLVGVATASESAASSMLPIVSEVPEAGGEITAAISELYAISSLLRQIDNCRHKSARRYDRISEDIKLILNTSSKTLRHMNSILKKSEHKRGPRRDVYKRLWQETVWIFKDVERNLTLQSRLHSYKSFLQKLLESLDVKLDRTVAMMLAANRADIKALSAGQQFIVERIQRIQQFENQPVATQTTATSRPTPIPNSGSRRPSAPPPAASYNHQYGVPRTSHTPTRPPVERPMSMPSFPVGYMHSRSHGRTLNEGPYAPPPVPAPKPQYQQPPPQTTTYAPPPFQYTQKRHSGQYTEAQMPMYHPTYHPGAGSPVSPGSPVSSSTTLSDSTASTLSPQSQCWGRRMEKVTRSDNETELIRITFDNDFDLKLWRDNDSLATRIVCTIGKGVKFVGFAGEGQRPHAGFQTYEQLSNLTISRQNITLLIKHRRTGQLWASVVFKRYDNLINFYLKFLSLRQLGPNAPPLLHTETFIEGEKMIFSAATIDRLDPAHPTRLQLRILKDTETGSVRVATCMKDDPFQDLPQWTMFMDKLIPTTGWLGTPEGNQNVVQMRGVDVFAINDAYRFLTGEKTNMMLEFASSDSSREFLRAFYGLRVGHL